MKSANGSVKQILGCLPQALGWNFVLGALALILGIGFGRPKIFIEETTALLAFCLLMVAYLFITCWSILTLAKFRKIGALAKTGPYKYIRHPIYAAVVLLLNPSLAILFRSWWLMIAVIPIYFIWRHYIKSEDKFLEEKFGREFIQYCRQTPPFLPNLHRINKPLFYSAVGLTIFTIVFIGLNSSAVYLRWVKWETKGKIVYDEPVPRPQNSLPDSLPNLSLSNNNYAANYSSKTNSIVINKINLEAPLVFAGGASQKELNAALNQGVIFYPGSKMPGEDGEVFLTGHSSVFPWNKTQYGQVFSLLDKLEKGDAVSIVYNNRQYDYIITGQQILPSNQVKITPTLEQKLTLMTCWPIGTSLKRLVVYGEMIK